MLLSRGIFGSLRHQQSKIFCSELELSEVGNSNCFRCKEKGAKRALTLPVSAPFHSALMLPAAENFAEVLKDISLNVPKIPVLQNYSLTLTSDDTDLIKENLIKQIYSPVPWVETINSFGQKGINRVVEIGPGKVLCGLNKRIAPEMEALAINDSASLEAAL